MFPLVHYAVNQQIFGKVSPLMAIGGLWPDMAIGANVQREAGHSKCKDFYCWCKKNAPDYLDLAKGALTHSTEPGCVDYYADEHFPEDLVCQGRPQPNIELCQQRFMTDKYRSEYPKGWCFAYGEAYLNEVSASTRLPDRLIWWKGHNFIEMGYELLTNEVSPQIKKNLLDLSCNKEAIADAAEILAEYYEASAERIKLIYSRIPILFALREVNPLALAKKQRRLFIMRFNHGGADTQAMADLIEKIQDDIRPSYQPLMNYLADHAKETLDQVDKNCC